MTAARVQEGDILAGKYRVERVLGEGGMGVVVAAFHLALEQRVAVKFLRKDMADRGDAAERFRREARAVARIQSEHVARVLDVGTMEDGETYIVMEYLDGNDLAEEMRKRGALPVSEAVDIALQIADAVSDAHASGIVHRDLKPANVFLVRRSDGSRLAKVLDFGISKSLMVDSGSNVSLTQTSTVMGSPLYMSPEQMRSARDVDGRTDIWALGAILYEALAGTPPHSGASLPEICTSLLQDTPRAIETMRGDVPPGLASIVMRCLAKEREDRWSTMRDFMQALAQYSPAAPNVGVLTALSPAPFTASATGPGTTPSPGSGTAGAPAVPKRPPQAQSGATEAPASLTLSSQTDAREARRARNVIFVGLAGAAVLVAVLATVAFRMTSRGDDLAKGADGVSPLPPKAAAAISVAPPETAVSPVGEQPTVPASVSVTPAAPPSSSSVAPPSAASVTERAGSAATRGTTPPKAPHVVEHTAPKQRPPGESITDFGGRR
jgi:serine/threonine-protein kinase